MNKIDKKIEAMLQSGNIDCKKLQALAKEKEDSKLFNIIKKHILIAKGSK